MPMWTNGHSVDVIKMAMKMLINKQKREKFNSSTRTLEMDFGGM